MSQISLTPVNSSFSLQVVEKTLPAVAAAIDESVREIWQKACAGNSALFDAAVLCVSEFASAEMTCFAVPYRFLYAQSRDERIKNSLNLHAVAVSGVVVINQKILFGQRSLQVSTHQGLMELVPSGGMPAPSCPGAADFRVQLLNELEEEINISSKLVKNVSPFAVIASPREAVVDICCEIHLDSTDEKRIISNFQKGEYTSLHMLSLPELVDEIMGDATQWVPTSALIIDYLGRRL